MRARRDYTLPVPQADARSDTDADTPVAGFYRTRLTKGGVLVGIKIWHGPPICPDTGEPMDRSWRWQAKCNEREIDIERVWPWCGRDPIDAKEYAYLTKLQGWAEENAPDSAIADPTRRIDLLSTDTPMPF